MKNAPDQRFGRTDLRNIAVILFLCCVFAYLRWLKLDTLVWGDSGRWLFEGQRVAAGEVPYRDFSWLYPPLSVLMLGWAMKLFGATFATAQVFVDLTSLVLVLLAYALIRFFLPRFLLLPVMVCLLAIGGTSLMFFGLFSFLIYVPALLTGAAGFLLLLIGLLSYLQSGRLKAETWSIITLGAFVAAYSKPETLLATYSTLVLLAIVDRQYWFAGKNTRDWFWHYAKVAVACGGPVLAAYVWMGAVAGFRNLWLGVSGYGVSSTACPWWPTGVGLFGATASLGEAAFIASALSLVLRQQFILRFGRAYQFALMAGLVGACVFVAYVLYSNWDLLTGSRSLSDKIWYSASSTLWSGAILLPVMWSCTVLWFYLVLRWLVAGRQSRSSLSMLVLLTGPVAMSSRGWFNWHLGVTTTVPAICYPFFIVLAPYLMWRVLMLAGPAPDLDRGVYARPGAAVAAVLIVYALLRVVGGYSSQLASRAYPGLPTLAGDIRLSSFAVDSEIYRFLIDNTESQDTILDIPVGGGMNLATHRLSPLFSTMFMDLKMPDDLLERDLERIRVRPPKVVIAQNAPNFGAFYGVNGCTCAFPHVVWIPPTSAVVPGKVFPAIAYIQQHYHVSKVVGQKLLLLPK
jgi:hypothetical protein